MSRRPPLTTGVPSLDDVLGGGIPAGSLVFVTGLPGSGKTILSEQAFFANAMRNASTLYLTTLSEPAVKMLHYAADFGYFRPEVIERSAHYADLGSSLRTNGTAGMLASLEELIRTRRPDFLVIDSFKVFHEHFTEMRAFREFVSDLAILLATWEVTAYLVGEYGFADIGTQPEFAIADGIIHLSGTEEPARQKRYMNIVKMRGANAFLGHHSYEIDGDGIRVFPRMLPRVTGGYQVSTERAGSAIPGLNELMGGGIRRGTTAVILGGTGTGKTLTAMSFLVEGVHQGENCLLVTFEESPEVLIANCADLGWRLQPGAGELSVMHVSPSELDIDRHAIAIKDRAEEVGAQRVVIDSVTAFGTSVSAEERVSAYLWGIADHFKRHGITLIMTHESRYPDEGWGGDGLFGRRVSYVADAIVELMLTQNEHGAASRSLRIVKIRGSQHDLGAHEFTIDAGGVRVRVRDAAPP